MTRMFDKYQENNLVDNTIAFLMKSLQEQDLIVLGASVTHTFKIEHPFDEIKHMLITYRQGTEDVDACRREYCPDDFVAVNTGILASDAEETISQWHAIDGTAELYEISEPMSPDFPELKMKACVLFYHLSPSQTLAFNPYNKNVVVQMRAEVESDVQPGEDKVEYSDIYKLEIKDSLFKGVRNN